MLIHVTLMLVPVCTAGLVLCCIRLQSKRAKRKTPLTANLLRCPGESLRTRIEDVTQDITFYMTIIFAEPFIVYSLHISTSYFEGIPETYSRILTSIFTGTGIVVLITIRVMKLIVRRRRLRLAHDAEMAVAQELNQLMHSKYHVFHDFPAERFNIDHVLVGPGGVFAVETKARAKPMNGNGKCEAKAIYDGKCLKFPGWTETKPMEQATGQARWLGRWLSSATGEPVEVQPVVALPGWFVSRVSSEGIPVLNPKLLQSFISKRKQKHSEESIKRIVHQLDQRCRDVEPKAYLPGPKQF